ncbi:MAG: hypothetical protein K8S15_04965 [Candidatus Aegiribacteria sp.]|nr:hypothetical protein [Candidatus Aegiribacteria sp.]
MNGIPITILVFSIAIVLSCGNEPDTISTGNHEYEVRNGISLDTLLKWKLYAESSDDGLWEGDSAHYILFDRVAILGDEEDSTPPFYNALYLHTMGDTLLIADQATQELVCMRPNGEMLWKAGESGEGPGHFHGIGTIASAGDWIAVANTGLGRIDFFSNSGVFTTTISIETPEDLIALSDSTLAVLSGTQQGGVIHIIHVDSGHIRSFGEIEGDSEMTLDSRFRDNLRGVFIPPDMIAFISRYEHRLHIFNLETEEPIFTGVRDLPSEPAKPYRSFNEETGIQSTVMFPSVGGVFRGPEGMINVVVDEYQNDGSLLHSNRYINYAPVTIIDRYDSNGEYLDSYCLPDSGISWVRMLHDHQLVGRQQGTGMVMIYEQFEEVH